MQVSPSKLLFTLFFSVVYIGLFAQFKSVSKTTLQKQMQFFAPQDKVNADILEKRKAFMLRNCVFVSNVKKKSKDRKCGVRIFVLT